MAIIEGTNYAKRDKNVLRIVLPDGEGGELTLSILPPTKGIHDSLMALARAMDQVDEGEMDDADFDIEEAFVTVAKCMGHNTEQHKVTPDFLDEINFDIDDVGDFIGSYLYFMSRLVMAKN